MTSSNKIPGLLQFGSESDTYIIELRPTTKCNYNCYYCHDLHNNRNPIIPVNVDSINRLISSAKRHLNKPVKVYIYGGEPSMYTDLLELINGISESCDDKDMIEIQSNFSRPVEWYKAICKELSYKQIVRFSGSFHNTQARITKFLQVCMLFKKNYLLNMVSFMYNRRECVMGDFNLGVKLLGENHCEISPLISSTYDQDSPENNNTDTEIDYIYDSEDVSKFTSHSFMFDNNIPYETDAGTSMTSRGEMWLNRDWNFKGMRCSIMKEKIYIDWNGEAYTCINDMLTTSNSLFNVNDDGIDYDGFYRNIDCFECPHMRCFFDMEFEKTWCK